MIGSFGKWIIKCETVSFSPIYFFLTLLCVQLAEHVYGSNHCVSDLLRLLILTVLIMRFWISQNGQTLNFLKILHFALVTTHQSIKVLRYPMKVVIVHCPVIFMITSIKFMIDFAFCQAPVTKHGKTYECAKLIKNLPNSPIILEFLNNEVCCYH